MALRAKHMQVFTAATDSWFCWLTPWTREQRLISELICCSGFTSTALCATWLSMHYLGKNHFKACSYDILQTCRWQGGCILIKSEIEVYLCSARQWFPSHCFYLLKSSLVRMPIKNKRFSVPLSSWCSVHISYAGKTTLGPCEAMWRAAEPESWL